MNYDKQIQDFLNNFHKIIRRKKQYNKIDQAKIIKIEDKTLTLSLEKPSKLTINTPVEIYKIKGKIIQNKNKTLKVQLEKNLSIKIHQKIKVIDTQNQIIINKLETLHTTITDKKINHHNHETLNAIFTTQYNNTYNDTTTNNKHLNPKQLEALNKSISTNKFHIIKGPPGTGKTHSIVAIINYLVDHDKKILITTHTHIAIDNILEKLDTIKDNKILRIGIKEKINPNVYKYTIDEQIKTHPEYQQIRQLKEENKKLEQMKENNSKDRINRSTSKSSQHQKNNSIIKRLISKFYNLENNQNTYNQNQEDNTSTQIINHISENNQQIQKIKNEIQHDLSENAQIIASTILSSSSNILKDIEFDYVIMDEASQVPLYMALIPLIKTKKFILIGDDKQLQPITPNNISNPLTKSIFNHMIEKYPQYHTFLNIQYRMNKQISDIASKLYYHDKLETYHENKNIQIHIDNRHFLLDDNPLVFIDTTNTQYHEENTGGGCINKKEARLIMNIIKYLTNNGITYEDIGIITPYRKQKLYIQQLQRQEKLNIETDTIYRFQGREKNIIIITFCKSSNRSLSRFQADFISNENQLNVSITRAKKKLIIIGDSSQLVQSKNLEKLIREITPLNTIYLEDIL